MPKPRPPTPGCCHVTYIYALCDPQTGTVGYVGKSDTPFKRYKHHLSEGRLYRYTGKCEWVNDCYRRGAPPTLRLLKIVPYDDWQRIESEFIRHHGAVSPLANWEYANPIRGRTDRPTGPIGMRP